MRLLLLLLCAGCTQTRECRQGTVFVSVTAPADADRLGVDISIDGAPPKHQEVGGLPGGKGSVEVRFPNSYPKGSTVMITINAYQQGALLGSGTGSVGLTGECGSLSLTVSVPDLAQAVDLGGVDLAEGPPDLIPPPDLLFLPDLTGIDLNGCVPVAESCFNGVDDDCDGLADCADPDCATPAVCVPAVVAPFGYFGQYPANDPCSGTVLYSGDNTGGGCTFGTCQCGESGCSRSVYTVNGACPNGTAGTLVATLNSGNTCVDLSGQTGNLMVGPGTGSLTCSVASGASNPVNPPVMSKNKYCAPATTPTAVGCAPGEACVPRAPNQCVVASGAGVACPGGYIKKSPDWYDNFSDNRSCSCFCDNVQGCTVTNLFFSNVCGSGTGYQYTCPNTNSKVSMVGSCIKKGQLTSGGITYNGTARTVCCLQ